MALYSAYQLIDKTFILRTSAPVYGVADIDELGDSAKPIGIMPVGGSFVMDSFLLPTAGYTDEYGITYAKRSYPYLTYFDGEDYRAIMLVNGRFDIPALTTQGTLTVAEEIAAEKAAAKEGTFGGFLDDLGLGDIGKWIKPALIIVGVVLLAPSIISSVKEVRKQKK